MSDQPVVRTRAAADVDGRPRDRSRPAAPEPLPHPVVDTHCHLDIADTDVVDGWDAAASITAAAAVGVARIVQIGCDLPSARWAVAAASHRPALVAGVALHPNEAPRLAGLGELDAAYTEIEALAADPVVRVVGETGLDFFRTTDSEALAVQRESFAWHVDLAKRLGKTLQIHDRDSHDDVLDLLDAEGAPERVVMHCFSGGVAFAKACLDRGFWLSFAGTVTFKNAPVLRSALAATPLDKVLVETDAPFLTPMPYRGRPNASYLVPLTVRAMAQVRAEDLGDLCMALDSNATTAFGGSWPAAATT